MLDDKSTVKVYLRWYQQPIVLAVMLLVILITLISYIANAHMRESQMVLAELIAKPLTKIQHLDSMVHYSRQRQVLLRDIVLSDDPFERDEIILEFGKLATRYRQARDNLEALLVDTREKTLLSRIKALNEQSYPLGQEIVDRAIGDEHEQALDLLRNSLMPSHGGIYPAMLELRDLLIEDSAQAAALNEQRMDEVIRHVTILYVVSISIGIILVMLAYRMQRGYQRDLAWQATHDPLTGMINRFQFEHMLAELTVSGPTKQTNALIYIDLDQFKLVNDTVGHTAGDELLMQVSEGLTRQCDSGMTLGRLGGDEFALLIENTDEEKAVDAAKKVLAFFSGFQFIWVDRIFDVTASIGLVLFKGQQLTKKELLTAADLACHTAKESGRNRFHIYKPTDVETSARLREMDWATRLREAMNDDRLKLYHQPIVCCGKKEKQGRTEILVRYEQDDNTLIGPFNMIQAAEKFGFANTLDEYVIERVFRYISEQEDNSAGIFNINLSGQSLESDRTLAAIIDMLHEYDIDPEHVCFEITETAAIKRFTNAQKFIKTLQGVGCKFALDDFGTGVSSFGYLDKLPVDMIKIDGGFIQNLQTDVSNRAIVTAIREVAKAFNIAVVAEGVENEVIRQQVEKLGVHYVQGYGVAMPEPLTAKVAA